MEFTVIEDEKEDDHCPDPREESMIIFEVLFDPVNKRHDITIEILDYEGGAAEYESEFSGFLDYAVEDLVGYTDPGIYVMEGFHTSFHQDYYGEVDAEHYYDFVRPATIEEIAAVYGANFWDNT